MRFTRSLLAAGLAVAVLAGGWPAQAAVPRPDGDRLPARARAALPEHARIGSTPERRAAWERLTPKQRDQVTERMRTLVGPRLRQAVAAAPARTDPTVDWRAAVAGTANGDRDTPAPSFSHRAPDTRKGKAAVAGDQDGDGLDQDFEGQVGDAFTPVYHVSAGEKAGTGFARFADSVPQTVVSVSGPVPPISHFRVQPLGFGTDAAGNPVGVLRLDYLTLWNRDDGLDLGGICGAATDLVGSLLGIDIRLGSHALDNERSAILVAAPVPAPGVFNPDPAAYSAYAFYTAAHEFFPVFDQSRYLVPDQPVPAFNHINLAFSRSKHSTYPFNPNGLPIVQSQFIALTYFIIDDLYLSGIIGPDTYLLFLFLADNAFFGCVVESFIEQGGVFAAPRIDVGEPSQPINGSGFIRDPDSGILEKFTIPLF